MMEFSPQTVTISYITINFDLFSNLILIRKNLPPNLNKGFIEPPCRVNMILSMFTWSGTMGRPTGRPYGFSAMSMGTGTSPACQEVLGTGPRPGPWVRVLQVCC